MSIEDLLKSLPRTPVDGYTVRWFAVAYDRVREHHAIYHKQRTWDELYPDEPGAGRPWVDQWQLFEGKHCTGRLDGWGAIREWENFLRESAFTTKAEAIAFLRTRLSNRVEQLKRELREITEQMDSL